jgi:hypothetical protein
LKYHSEGIYTSAARFHRTYNFSFFFPVVGAKAIYFLPHRFPICIRFHLLVPSYKYVISFIFLFRSQYFDFTCHKAGKVRYTSINSHMNSLGVDVLAMMTEPQLNRYCAILTLNDASLLAQYIFNSLNAPSIIAQVFNTVPTRQL